MREMYSWWGIFSALLAYVALGVSIYTGDYYWLGGYYLLGLGFMVIWQIQSLRSPCFSKKMPWWVDAVLMILIPVGFPISFLITTAISLKEKYIDHKTVRGIFKKYHTEISYIPEGTPTITKEEQKIRGLEIQDFFLKYWRTFEGLPGGIESMKSYDTHCGFHLTIGELKIARYYIRWDEMDEFLHEIIVWNSKTGRL